MNKVARLRIWRGKAGDAGRYDEFDVAFQDGESVLDGLVKIRSTDAPDLAFQFSCFNANVCKECAVQINGAVEYACIAKLVPGVTQLDPVPGQRILRDLFIETREREQKGATLRHQMLSLRTGRSH
jgi:succinate dehydrogenase/fumarate reductase-like Fe-S protein